MNQCIDLDEIDVKSVEGTSFHSGKWAPNPILKGTKCITQYPVEGHRHHIHVGELVLDLHRIVVFMPNFHQVINRQNVEHLFYLMLALSLIGRLTLIITFLLETRYLCCCGHKEMNYRHQTPRR